jgi:hypothetical protein
MQRPPLAKAARSGAPPTLGWGGSDFQTNIKIKGDGQEYPSYAS